MTNETRRTVDEARAAANTAREIAAARLQECLDVVADGLAAAVDRLAKNIAQAQPDVTKELGATGIKALREELAAEAAKLAEYVRNGREKIAWPGRDSQWSTVNARQIHSALFKYMYGQPVNQVGNVFGRHGYDLRQAERSGAQALILPQELYDEESFDPVASALNELGAAEIALKKAKAEDDKATVDSLWDEA